MNDQTNDPAGGPPDPIQKIAALDATARKVYTDLPDGRMVWRIWGTGPALVLVHGAHGSWLHWIRQIEHMRHRFMLIVPDMPGYGDSDMVDDGDTAPLIDALQTGLEAIELPARIWLAAFSFGAVPASALLARLPHRFEHFYMIGANAFGTVKSVGNEMRRWRDVEGEGAQAEVHRHNLRLLMLHDPAAADQEAVTLQKINTSKARYRAEVVFRKIDVPAELAAASVPMTFVWGAEDILYRHEWAEREAAVRQAHPDARFVLIPGAGHWVIFEAPKAIERILLAPLQEEII